MENVLVSELQFKDDTMICLGVTAEKEGILIWIEHFKGYCFEMIYGSDQY